MVEGRRRHSPAVTVTAGEDKGMMEGETGEDPLVVLDSYESDSELARLRLRERWELASVLNFLNVFEPIIGSDLKISAEEIEMGLIKPNSLLAKLHISLLKGIPPVSKTLNTSDVWVTVLCKKLAAWWPWVSEGDIPLSAANGEEISRYKELNPTIRLLILKALCEIRADQDDIVSYINDALKNGTQISCFRKDNIGGDGNGTTYWYDGNEITGHRLYREVKKFKSKPKIKGKEYLRLPTISLQWETLATNLEEFHKVADEFSSSKVMVEVAVHKNIEADAIPVLEKLHKKKERALKRQQRQEILLNYQNSFVAGITRSCRNRRPVSYTFDEYDRAIDEALEVTKKRKTTDEQRQEGKHSEHGERNDITYDGDLDMDTQLRDGSVGKRDSMGSDTNIDKGNDDDDKDDRDYDGEKDDDSDNGSDSSNSDKENGNLGNGNHATLQSQKQKGFTHKAVGLRWSKRLLAAAEISSHPVAETRNTRSLGTKNRLRQRPTRNTAIESVVVPDSEDEDPSENTITDVSGRENLSSDGDAEEDNNS